MGVEVRTETAGSVPGVGPIEAITLESSGGLTVRVLSWGCIITSVRVPDRSGNAGEVTLAFDALEEYVAGHPFYGAFVGRVANRISGGGFTLDGRFFPLAPMKGGLHLHGGSGGFHARGYDLGVTTEPDAAHAIFHRVSADGEEGYPGALTVSHTITVTADNRLRFTFDCQTDAPTVVNLTNHTYWNLAGGGSALDHTVELHADQVAEQRNALVTGRILDVADTPLDFRSPKPLGRDLEAIVSAEINGYDHSFLVRGADPDSPQLLPAATVSEGTSGRRMEVLTTYPVVHLYSGNNLTGQRDRDGKTLAGREALCLECQYLPDSPNRPEFPSIVLRPGERYHHVTEHRFTTE